MKKKHDVKVVIAIVMTFLVIVGFYIARSFYVRYTGKIETEYIFKTIEKENVTAEGFVVRDESRVEGGNNISILKKSDNKVYVPVVSDSTSVARGDTIATAFQSNSQAEAYRKKLEVEGKIEYLDHLQNQSNLNLINVVTLNSEINSSINSYMKIVDSKDLSNLDDAVKNINYKITTKQIATGASLDFSKQIRAYQKEKSMYEKEIKGSTSVTTSYAGYFISNVDGYESVLDYNDVSTGNITSDQIKEALKSKKNKTDDSFGKIIGQHTWYYVCNLSLTNASNLGKNVYVYVDFPEKGVYDIPMLVKYVSDKAGNTVSVVLKCTLMNESLAGLRKEKAEITIKTYEGYKISNEALSTNDEGLTGVYVLNGKRVTFKPINVLYSGNDYVIAGRYLVYDDKGQINESLSDYPAIKEFDNVILKGRNLEDGKVID